MDARLLERRLHRRPKRRQRLAAGDCAQRVLRGGAWLSKPPSLRAANRGKEAIEGRYINNGFRLARALAPSDRNEPRPEIP